MVKLLEEENPIANADLNLNRLIIKLIIEVVQLYQEDH